MEIVGLALILIGIFSIILGFFILAFLRKSSIEGGGAILIGPFPIVFGTNERMIYIAIFVTLLAIFLYLLIVVLSWRLS